MDFLIYCLLALHFGVNIGILTFMIMWEDVDFWEAIITLLIGWVLLIYYYNE